MADVQVLEEKLGEAISEVRHWSFRMIDCVEDGLDLSKGQWQRIVEHCVDADVTGVERSMVLELVWGAVQEIRAKKVN